MRQRTCLRCGLESDSKVRMKLVRYDEGKPFGAEWRCTNLKECSDRVAQQEEVKP